MASRRPARMVGFGVILVVVGVNGYFLWRPEPAAPIVGVVRTTEVRVAPEVGGQLAAIKVQKGARVRAGDVVAELSADELTASVAQALAQSGWIEGRNVRIEIRWGASDPERIRRYVAELVALAPRCHPGC